MTRHEWKRDCKAFPGTYACDIMTSEEYESCAECKFYDPKGKKVLIIKLGAMGDVIRTTAILPSIKKKYGEDTQITWVVNPESKESIKGDTHIDRIWGYTPETIMRVEQEKFDVLLSLEIDVPGTTLANKVKAKEKYGYYYAEDGHPMFFNKAAEYYLTRVFSNKINKKNTKNYQQMMCEIAEIPINETYTIELDAQQKKYQEKVRKEWNISEKEELIGVNVGAGERWKSKFWKKEQTLECIKELVKKKKKVVLLGGKQEVATKEWLTKQLENEKMQVVSNNTENSVKEFIATVDLCSQIITGDTLAMHIALGLKKKVIAVFFCTPAWEVADQKGLIKIQSQLLDKYFFDDQYHEELVQSITPKQVITMIS